MQIPSLSLLFQSAYAAVRRFPLAMLSALVGVLSLMMLIEDDHSPEMFKLYLMAQLGVPLFIAITTVIESRGWGPRDWKRWGNVGGGLALLVLYFFLMPDPRESYFAQVDGVRYAILLGVAHLLVAFSPYLNRLSVSDFWEYNKQLFGNFLAGAVYTLILWAGLSLAVLAADRLFHVDVDHKIYAHLFVLLAGLFNTTFFLAHFPTDYTFAPDERTYNALFKNLCKYVLMPIAILYFLILYAYGFKIILGWELPEGWVSKLVIGFSVAGILTYLLNHQLPNYDTGALTRLYRRWFWWVMMPLAILLFVAIGRRIGDYGVTEARYFVATTGVWLMACSVFFALSKSDNIKFIPISLALILLVSVLGPFSAFAVARRSQTHILEKWLSENGLLQNGKIVPLKSPTAEEKAARIEASLSYFEQHGALKHLQPLFPLPMDSIPLMALSYNKATNLTLWMGAKKPEKGSETTIYVTPNAEVNTGNLRGYETWYRLTLHEDDRSPGRGRYFAISETGDALVWREKKGSRPVDMEYFNLSTRLRTWLDKSDGRAYYLPVGEETFDFNGRLAEIRVVVKEAEVARRAGKPALVRLDGMLFLKEKK